MERRPLSLVGTDWQCPALSQCPCLFQGKKQLLRRPGGQCAGRSWPRVPWQPHSALVAPRSAGGTSARTGSGARGRVHPGGGRRTGNEGQGAHIPGSSCTLQCVESVARLCRVIAPAQFWARRAPMGPHMQPRPFLHLLLERCSEAGLLPGHSWKRHVMPPCPASPMGTERVAPWPTTCPSSQAAPTRVSIS